MAACSVCGIEMGRSGVTFSAGDTPLLRACASCEPTVRHAGALARELGVKKFGALLETRAPHALAAVRAALQVMNSARKTQAP